MIQRYTVTPEYTMTTVDGPFVLHTDHLAVLAERDAEIAKLREEVAVFGKGMPTKYGMEKCANIAHEKMQHGEYNNEAMRCVDWLRSIAAKVRVES